MTELEIMQRAKMYMDKLSQGFDPISDRTLPNDTALNNQRLQKCFAYVAGVLEKAIDRGGDLRGYDDREPFYATAEQLAKVQLFAEPATISQLVDRINEAISSPNMRKLSATMLTNWLLDKGFLIKAIRADGKNQRLPSESGHLLGISSRQVSGLRGEYTQVLYGSTAQQFLLDNLPAIIEERIERNKKEQ